MKLTFIDDFKLAAITDAGAVSLASAITDIQILPPQQQINQVISQWATYKR